MNNTQEDIRDIEIGQEYWVITDPARGGRCVMAGMFPAAFRTKKDAKATAEAMSQEGTLAKGWAILRTRKS